MGVEEGATKQEMTDAPSDRIRSALAKSNSVGKIWISEGYPPFNISIRIGQRKDFGSRAILVQEIYASEN
jgi:hypothetical protein